METHMLTVTVSTPFNSYLTAGANTVAGHWYSKVFHRPVHSCLT